MLQIFLKMYISLGCIGDIHFDNSEEWAKGASDTGKTNLLWVATHEMKREVEATHKFESKIYSTITKFAKKEMAQA